FFFMGFNFVPFFGFGLVLIPGGMFIKLRALVLFFLGNSQLRGVIFGMVFFGFSIWVLFGVKVFPVQQKNHPRLAELNPDTLPEGDPVRPAGPQYAPPVFL
ncbi:hypothetical protein, partial [Enterobacter intestinihominis]